MTVTRTTVTETIERQVIDSVTCDLCGHQQTAAYPQEEDQVDSLFMVSRWTAGYGSGYDMTTFEVSLCDGCMALLGGTSEEKQALQQSVAQARRDQKGVRQGE